VTLDTIIIGGGAMGSATAYWLSKYQDSVMMLDQFDLLHHNGSSHGMSRVIRKTYDLPHFAVMMDEAYTLWENIQKETGKNVYTKTGGLNLGPESQKDLQHTIRISKERGFEHEVLDSNQLQERYPAFNCDDDYLGVYQAETGILNASSAVEMLQTQASHQGADLRGNQAVTRIRTTGDTIRVECGDKSYETKNVVISAGVWLNEHLRQFDLRVAVEAWKLTFAYWKTLKPEWYTPEKFPVFIHWADEINYGFPIHERPDFVKIAPHITEKIPKLSDYDNNNSVNHDLLDEMKRFVSKRFNQLEAVPQYAETCLYTMTKDENFIMDRLPDNDQIFVAGGFSGHGFKFTPLIGKLMADMVLENEIQYDMNHFKLENTLV
jgi:monomeric sarcosine oxidase